MHEPLAIGCSYETAQGQVTLIAVVPDRTVAKGVCYEFELKDGNTCFIRPNEIDKFFDEDDD